MSALLRNNVRVTGRGETPMIFAHGYGCDQVMWRLIRPSFEDDFQTVTYDTVGSGQSDLSAYDRKKYRTLEGHADDLLEICDELALSKAIVVGHSVSAMTAVLAANKEPERFSALVMVAPSPRYLNDEGYVGGFEKADIEGLLEFLDSNFLGWSKKMAPVIMGVQNQPELAEELTMSFCRTDPDIAKHFGRVTFLSDHRADVKVLQHPTLILQCSDDIIAPLEIGQWLHDNIRDSELVVMKAQGHCPHLSAPAETISAIKSFLSSHLRE
jgi:sigma-B regulation protein RsbQ